MKGPELAQHASKGSTVAQAEIDRRAARKEAAGGKIGGRKEGVAFNPPAKTTSMSRSGYHWDHLEPGNAARKQEFNNLPSEVREVVKNKYADLDDSNNNQTVAANWQTALASVAKAAPKEESGHTGTYAELQQSHPTGAQAYVKGYGIGTIVQHHPAKNDNSAVTVDVPGHGLIKRTIDQVQVGKDIPAAALAAKARREEMQVETNRKIAENAAKRAAEATEPEKSERVKYSEARQAERDRELADFNARIDERKKTREAAVASDAEKPATVAPAGYTSSPTESYPGMETVTHSSGARIGSTRVGVDYTKENRPSIFSARYNGKELSKHETREAAVKAIVDKHKADLLRTQVADAKTLAASQKAAAGTPWEARAFEHDSTISGMEAARKIKQSFKFGNHSVTIEPSLTKAQTQDLLSSIHQTVTKANLHNETINFHVPTGDKNFRERRGKAPTLGYVRYGGNTVYVNPKVTTGEKGDNSREVATGHFMPAAANTSKLGYVLTHEIGHVLDGSHSHTRMGTERINNVEIPTSRPVNATQLYSKHRSQPGVEAAGGEGGLSKYGKTSLTESYAEAYAQWVHGGPGSSKVADEYAKEFGWAPPQK